MTYIIYTGIPRMCMCITEIVGYDGCYFININWNYGENLYQSGSYISYHSAEDYCRAQGGLASMTTPNETAMAVSK